jgi:hypothetical protein
VPGCFAISEFRLEQLAQPKIGQFHPSAAVDQNIPRLQIKSPATLDATVCISVPETLLWCKSPVTAVPTESACKPSTRTASKCLEAKEGIASIYEWEETRMSKWTEDRVAIESRSTANISAAEDADRGLLDQRVVGEFEGRQRHIAEVSARR